MKYVTRKIRKLNLTHLIIFNIVAFLAIKAIIPLSVSQFADIGTVVTPFDSREIVSQTNKARLAQNLIALKANTKLDLAAYEKMRDMIKNNYFAHVSPSGVTPWAWIKDSGYKYSYAGENLALGFTSAADTVKAWLNSPGHKANLLNSHYSEIGVATGLASINGISGVLVVQTFGRPSATVINTSKLKPTAISTDPKVPSRSGAITKDLYASFEEAGRLVNAYVLYLISLIAIIGIAGIFKGYSRKMLLTMGVSFNLLIMVFIVPAFQLVTRTSIF
ncbi:CAP domain-containing protein [Candidatus Parcubacteria bacterium]|nr:CAP domain-containing protein [Candidatus Parcubacteria bacterium]